MVSALLSRRRPVIGHHPLGASTGYMSSQRGCWPALLKETCEVSAVAAEFAALGEEELPELAAFLMSGAELPFRYLSVHAPTKRLSLPERERVAQLALLPPEVDAIVVHPDTIEAPALWSVLGHRLVLENMDRRKARGRTAAELAPLFDELPDAGLCFDVAHAQSIDASMAAGHAVLDAFAHRLRHVHVSSLDREAHHVPLTVEDEVAFAPLLARCRDVPWILEAPLPTT